MPQSAARFFELQARRKLSSFCLTLNGGDGLPSSTDFAAGCVGFTHRRLVCGPPSEHILQLHPPVPVDLSPGLPLSSVHGKTTVITAATLTESFFYK